LIYIITRPTYLTSLSGQTAAGSENKQHTRALYAWTFSMCDTIRRLGQHYKQ